MNNFLDAANSMWLWLACVPTIVLMISQSAIFAKKAKNAAVLVDLSQSEVKKAFKVGLISAIGPAFGVFVVMLGLSSQIGSPLAWQRLSIIGAAHTELAASEMAAQAMGTHLGAENYNIMNFANLCWVLALNGANWLIISGLFTDKLDIASKRITKGDPALLGVISIGAIIGIMSYFFANELNKGLKPGQGAFIVAGIFAALSMIGLDAIAKKHPKITEYIMGIAMVIGMISAVVFNKIAA